MLADENQRREVREREAIVATPDAVVDAAGEAGKEYVLVGLEVTFRRGRNG